MGINEDYRVPIPTERLRELVKKARVDMAWISERFEPVGRETIKHWLRGTTKNTYSFYLDPLIKLLEKRIKDLENSPLKKYGSPPDGIHPLTKDGNVAVACPTEKIKFYFNAAGISQQKLAARCGVLQSKISHWLRGQISVDPHDLDRFFRTIEKMVPSVKREWESLSANLPLKSLSGPNEKPE